ncbi:hypothetical protein, partial [Chromobacterium haemolyticum]|uniref:hypothetical protein n=1 Tax=Chromobacterium haemolyticum TaxID=394935 RepID=UPI0019308F45
MSAMIAPEFPLTGYQPVSLQSVMQRRGEQQREVDLAKCQAREEGRPSPCVQALHISLFFDGTNNHGPSDDQADPVNSSNVRRLYNASIGNG